MNEAIIQDVIAAAPVEPGPTETLSDAIARLSQLPPLDYDKVRAAEAKVHGIRVTTLDGQVQKTRFVANEIAGKEQMFPTVEPWPEPVVGATLLDEIYTTLRRFIVCKSETAVAATLWIAFTWFIDHVQVAPLAIITAPEKRCGKSQLLNLFQMLSRKPIVASGISSSALFRVIEGYSPTILLDEADTFMKENEALRGVIDSGHTRQSAFIIRTVGEKYEVKQFRTWGAKAISGIGKLSDTVMDRSILLELRRKLPHEKAERLRYAEPELFARLASMLARWAVDNGEIVGCSRPALPDALNDRAQDNWEPLLAIADCAGGEWTDAARNAALRLSRPEGDVISLSAELLADIQRIFTSRNSDRISTADLLAELAKDIDAPWATLDRGNPMTSRQLAKQVDAYGIQSRNIKIGRLVFKGYMLSDFAETFARYLTASSSHELSATSLPTEENDKQSTDCTVADSTVCTNDANTIRYSIPDEHQSGSGIADQVPSNSMAIMPSMLHPGAATDLPNDFVSKFD